MKQLEKNEEGFRTSVGSIHLESSLHDGLYRDNPGIKQFGMLLIHENESMAFYRTDNGIVLDLKQSRQHLMLGTANYGDPIPKAVWLCIARAMADELDGVFMADSFVPSHALEKASTDYIAVFFSHMRHFEV